MINCMGVIGVGFVIGILSGLFGVGGGFLLVPLLNAVFNVPYNIAIGSSLLQMVGTSTASTLKHRGYGHIDDKLAGFILIGSVVGVELGARVLMRLKNLGTITINAFTISTMDFWISIIYIILLSLVGTSMFLESKKAKKRAPRGGIVDSVFSQKIQSIKIPPLISLPTSKIGIIRSGRGLYYEPCFNLLNRSSYKCSYRNRSFSDYICLRIWSYYPFIEREYRF